MRMICNYRSNLALRHVGLLLMHFILSLHSCSSKNSTENYTPLGHKNQTQGSHLPRFSPYFFFFFLIQTCPKRSSLLLLSAEKRLEKSEQKQAVHSTKRSPFIQNPHQREDSLRVLKLEPQVFIKAVCEARSINRHRPFCLL